MNYGEGESEREEEKDGLDLLTAMLDNGSTKSKSATKAITRKRSSTQEGRGSEALKRRKVEESDQAESTESATDDVSLMKGISPQLWADEPSISPTMLR